MKILFDTNVLISAFMVNGVCYEVVHDSIDQHELYYTDFIIGEFKKVFKDDLHFSEAVIKEFTAFIEKFFMKGNTASKVEDVCKDKDDNQLLADAGLNGIDIIITGDKEVLNLKTYKSIRIISPVEYWRL